MLGTEKEQLLTVPSSQSIERRQGKSVFTFMLIGILIPYWFLLRRCTYWYIFTGWPITSFHSLRLRPLWLYNKLIKWWWFLLEVYLIQWLTSQVKFYLLPILLALGLLTPVLHSQPKSLGNPHARIPSELAWRHSAPFSIAFYSFTSFIVELPLRFLSGKCLHSPPSSFQGSWHQTYVVLGRS